MLVGHHVEAGVGATSRFSASARQAPPTSIEYFEPEIVKLVKELSRALPRAEYQRYLGEIAEKLGPGAEGWISCKD